MSTQAPPVRRIVAIVVPKLLLELGRASLVPRSSKGRFLGKDRPSAPLGILLVDGVQQPAFGEAPADEGGAVKEKDPAEPPPTGVLAAVDETAARFGVRVGQTVAEAHAFVSKLVVREVTRDRVRARLGEIAEVAMGFGPTVGIESPDTVWVDVTGAAHLSGGEGALAQEVVGRVRALGHAVRVAVASGPHLSQAFARWGRMNRDATLVVPDEEAATRVAALPVRALPIDAERAAWLLRLGVVSFGDLARLPRAATASRLGDDAAHVLDLAEGKDATPVVPYTPQLVPKEESSWDEPVDAMEPLLFVLRGLLSRFGARLEGRGEAVQALDLHLLHDRASAAHLGVAAISTMHFEFAAPLYRCEELFRVLSSRLGRAEIAAPTVGLRLEGRAITRALALQLPLSRYAAGLGGSAGKGPETLPVLLAELGADVGKDKVGVLRIQSSHRPERKSRLSPVTHAMLAVPGVKKARRTAPSAPPDEAGVCKVRAPARLLPRPLPFEAPLRRGATLSVERRLYTVESITFERRLDAVEWWTGEPVSRDYLRVWLQSGNGGLEALVYVDRETGKRMIQGFCD